MIAPVEAHVMSLTVGHTLSFFSQLTCSLTHPPTHPPTHPLTHSLASTDIHERLLTGCLQDGTSKMSKSAELDTSRINLLDDPKLIQQKVKRAKTDTFDGLEWGNPDRPEATNLLGIYSLCTGISMVSLSPFSVCNMPWYFAHVALRS